MRWPAGPRAGAGRGRATICASAPRRSPWPAWRLPGWWPGVGSVEAYPTISMAFGAPEVALAVAFVVLGLAPLTGPAARRGVRRD